MQSRFMAKWVLILSALAVLGWIVSCAPQQASLDPFPARVLKELSLQKREAPPGYAWISNTNLLAQSGLSQNPGYLTRRSDLEDMIQMNGAAGFLALYGPGEAVRLMVKGVFFWQPEHAEKYAEVQSTRQRLVMAYRRDTTAGTWLLFIACDPEEPYDEAQIRLIKQRLERYQSRLDLTLLFDQMKADQAK